MEFLATFILWIVISIVAFLPYVEKVKEESNGIKIGVGLIFLIGGSIFAINGILTYLLDIIIPGWDEEDNKFS